MQRRPQASKGEEGSSQRVLRGCFSASPLSRLAPRQSPISPSAHQRRLLITSEASAKGRVGSWRPSWVPTPIPSQPTEALPSSSRSGDRILLVLEFFAQKQGGALL